MERKLPRSRGSLWHWQSTAAPLVARCGMQALQELRLAGARSLAAGAARRLAAAHVAAAPQCTPHRGWARCIAAPSCLGLEGINISRRGASRQLHTSRVIAEAAQGSGASNGGSPLLPDWRVGVALAGASFEAYGELSEGGLPEKHANGTEVHYVDR